MTDSDIQLDEEPAVSKPKGGISPIMVAMVIITFTCLVVMLVLQYSEYRYFRGGPESDSDTYSADVLLYSS